MENDDRETTGPRADTVERILAMTQEEVDDLPYGFIVLDEEGTILLYNRYEARMSRVPPEEVVGRNFFLDVAPCTRVEAFHGRFRALVSDPARTSDRFSFSFHFLHGAQDVLVRFARVPSDDAGQGSALAGARVFMTVERRLADTAAHALPSALTLDAERGHGVGPLGPVFPFPAAALSLSLAQLGQQGARDLGRTLGGLIAVAATNDANRNGEPDLSHAPGQLVAGALDDALARAGLGRLALDQTARAEAGVIGCMVRPAVGLATRPLASLYEGLIEAALSTLLGQALTARCLDDRALGALPWRLALAPTARADILAPQPGELSDDVARRLGLLVDASP